MATNKVYIAEGTTLTFKGSGGDAVITLANLAFGTGRVSAQYDRGASARPKRYKWRAVMQFDTAPVVGETVEIWLFTSRNGTIIDGTVGASDAAFTSAKKPNGILMGVVTVETTSTATNNIASGVIDIYDRYISVGVWNGSAGDNLQNTANVSYVELTPFPDDIQAAA